MNSEQKEARLNAGPLFLPASDEVREGCIPDADYLGMTSVAVQFGDDRNENSFDLSVGCFPARG